MDLNQTIDDVLVWDFPITFNGVTFPTRPLTLADLTFIARMRDPDVKSRPRMIDVAKRLFATADGLDDWLGAFRGEHLIAAISATVQYAMEAMGKNSQAITSRVKEVMAGTFAPSAGSSTQPPSKPPEL